MENYFGINSNDIQVYGIVAGRAMVGWENKTYKVAVGDTIAGGKITILNNQELVFVRNGEEIHYPLGRKK